MGIKLHRIDAWRRSDGKSLVDIRAVYDRRGLVNIRAAYDRSDLGGHQTGQGYDPSF